MFDDRIFIFKTIRYIIQIFSIIQAFRIINKYLRFRL